ncbi:DUF624 domain-containing protein [Lapidilactobacillus luobeiensis]|uniref:DUF624 domain-containing protein n=1 Tax=Lapidilactobacillus luobeiensis TaxID=2950371 RepID=UPI0021C36866|nr:DUF624 domain-containing protein [Lapidilactobacillus luobeiensis]
MKKQSFENNVYMKIFNWLYIFFVTSLLFSIVNLPFVLCVLFLALDVRNALIFWGSLLFFGPALMAGLAVIDRFMEIKTASPFKDYFHFLRQFFKVGFLYGAITLLIIGIFGTDIYFFMLHQKIGQFLVPLMLILMVVVLALFVNVIYFQIRNPQRDFKSVLKVSLYYLAKRWYLALINALVLLLLPTLMLIKPQFGMVLTPSLIMLLLYLNCGFLGVTSLAQGLPWSDHSTKD